MYFLIYKIGNSLRKKTFDNGTPHDVMMSSFKGTVVDFFKSDKLTPRHFHDYFSQLVAFPHLLEEEFTGV